MPDALWKRILIRTVLIGFYSFILLVLLIAGIIGAFQIPAVSGLFFKTMLKMGWEDFPPQKPPVAEAATPPAFTSSITPQPETASELFQWDQVWQAHIRFNSNQWHQLSPLKIPPSPGAFSPKMTLRNPKASRAGLLGVMGWDLPWSKAESLHFNGQIFTNIAARYKGNGTFLESKQNYKRSFKLDLNEFVKGQKLAKQETVNFHNLLADRSRMNDALGYRYFRMAGVPSPRTTFVDMTLEIDEMLPPSMLGLYLMVEKPDNKWLKDFFGKEGGAVFKPVTLTLFKYLSDNWADYAPVYGPKSDLTDAQKQHLISTAKWFSNVSPETISNEMGQYFDIDLTARFFAGQVILSNCDGILFNGQNFLMVMAPETNLISFAPWDLDHSWGEFPFTGSYSDRIHASIHQPWIGENFFVEKLFQAEIFKEAYLAAMRDQLSNTSDEETLTHEVDHLAAILSPIVKKESEHRFEQFQKSSLDTDQPGVASSNPMDPNRPVHQLKRFVRERKQSIESQLSGEEEGIHISVEF
jgi:spore coat protein H